MERANDGHRLVVIDSSFLINFLVLDRMDILDRFRHPPRSSTRASAAGSKPRSKAAS